MKNRVLLLVFFLGALVGLNRVARCFPSQGRGLPHFGRARTQPQAVSRHGIALSAPSVVDVNSARSYIGNDIEVDPTGTAFVVGAEIFGLGAAEGPSAYNGWLAKYDRFHVLQSSVVYPNTWFPRMTRDTSGNVYVVGSEDLGTESNILIAKYSPALELLKTRVVDGASETDWDEATDISIAPNGNLVVVGTIFDDPYNPDVWIAQYDTNLTVLSSATYNVPGGSFSRASGLAIDRAGNIFVVATFENLSLGERKVMVVEFDSRLKWLKSSEITKPENFQKYFSPSILRANQAGEIFVAGDYYQVGDGYSSLWATKLSNNLTVLNSMTFTPSPKDDWVGGLAVAPTGDVYLSGVINDNEDEVNYHGETPVKSLGWIAHLNSSLVLKSSVTFSGTESLGINGAGGSRILGNSLYVAGAVTNTGTGTVGWVSQYALGENLLPLEDGNSVESARGYPSVFQPSRGHTHVTFDRLAIDSKVRIYSMAGVLVKTLQAEFGSVDWNVKNEGGENVASGVYYAVIDGSGGGKNLKIVVQR